jgi:ParB/RepB/Spo0J family partition protein
MAEIIYVHHEQLDHDPDNPRRFYLKDDLAQMGHTIEANGGVDQALLVLPNGFLPDGRPGYLVVDGNFRLAATRLLDKQAPLLKCEVLGDLNRKQKLLIMVRTAEQHYPKDPISEAQLFRELHVVEGMSAQEISRNLGCSTPLIASRLRLLDLDRPIRDLVARGRLPKDRRATEALLGIPDTDTRVGLAQELARRRASINTILRACERLKERQATDRRERSAQERIEQGEPPGVAYAASHPERTKFENIDEADWETVRRSAKSACSACDLKTGALEHVEEPSWSLFSHAAGETCDLCSLKTIRDVCRGCPLPEFLIRLAREAKERKEVDCLEHVEGPFPGRAD